MKYFISIIVLLTAFTIFAQTETPELPKPPEGYLWQYCPEIKAAFLKPNGWYFKKTESKRTLSYFITKENISKNKSFTTGLSVNVFTNFRDDVRKEAAYQYALEFFQSAKQKSDVENEWLHDYGPFKSIGFVILDRKKPVIRIHYLLIANMKTNTLYLFSYEAPLKNWTEAWKTGEPILKKLMIDDTIQFNQLFAI